MIRLKVSRWSHIGVLLKSREQVLEAKGGFRTPQFAQVCFWMCRLRRPHLRKNVRKGFRMYPESGQQ